MELDLNNLAAFRVLGRGAMGTVFLAADLSSPSLPPFALKVVDKHDPSAKPDADRRARWEIYVLSRLLNDPHPFLPSLIGSVESPDFLAWAIPFCPAGDLNSLRHSLSPDSVFSAAAIRFYLSEIISALSHLHSIGIVYRDLKPENVLLQSSGHIILTDFDLSRYLHPRFIFPLPLLPSHSPPPRHNRRRRRNLTRIFFSIPAASSTSSPERSALPDQLKKAKSARVSPVSRPRTSFSGERSYSFVGTQEYVSPEVVRGDGHNFAVDWWALGILTYEMAYGRTPFRGRSRKETFRNVLTKQPEFVGKHRSGLTDLISRLLSKDPTRRLGYVGGAEEVKAHPFFNGVKWELLADVGRPPFLATAEEMEEGEVRLNASDRTASFDVRDYFKKVRQEQAAAVKSPSSVSLTEF
ncbi:Serine/threonine-protein kinase OXI1 [Apostasia shenzhenica]|uniref:non-specific serine/threonine protein kinase n=1 Tax=Apostasia shenzhenica TaxID=1088818 RepID=A0A2I0A6A0_9ASPA|nr:Serine/threonine-protein kinase OXI1 [Apostasia shenzhenica]